MPFRPAGNRSSRIIASRARLTARAAEAAWRRFSFRSGCSPSRGELRPCQSLPIGQPHRGKAKCDIEVGNLDNIIPAQMFLGFCKGAIHGFDLAATNAKRSCRLYTLQSSPPRRMPSAFIRSLRAKYPAIIFSNSGVPRRVQVWGRCRSIACIAWFVSF